jgi:hypothetical protein
MEITEIYQLAIWVQKELVKSQITNNFNALINILNANAKRQNNQQAQPFEQQKNNLIDSLTSININTLTLSQIESLETAEIYQNIGQLGKNKVQEILSNTLDIAHVTQQISVMNTQLQQGIGQFNNLKKALQPFVNEDVSLLSKDEVLTRVIFEHEASVNNINELKLWSSKWFDIGRGFSIANGQTPEDVKVIGGGRGSLIIELALLATTALPIAKAINLTLDSMVKYQDFKLKAHEVRKLKDDNPNLIDDLEDDAKRWEDRASNLKKEIVEEIYDKIQNDFSDFRPENKAELNNAIKNLVDFISKGGDIDCVINDDINDEGDQEPSENLNKKGVKSTLDS